MRAQRFGPQRVCVGHVPAAVHQVERVRSGDLLQGVGAQLRKAQRFRTLGTERSFTDYVFGRASDNDAILPYDAPMRTLRPNDERRREDSVSSAEL